MKRIFFLLILTLSTAVSAQSGASVITEYEIKAAFLYNFAKFVDWPEEIAGTDSGKIYIGVLGQSPFGGVLEKIVQDRRIDGRTIVIKEFKRLQELDFCHILYISNSESRRLRRIFGQLSKENTLTVGESNDFLTKGGVIRLVNKRNKVRFEIDLEAANKAQLTISSRLLKLAENLKGTHTNGRK